MIARWLPELHWTEGMLLLPHHFQAFSQEIGARLNDDRTSWGPARWGVRDLDIEVSAAEILVRRARVVFSSGAAIDIPGNCLLEARPLGDALERAGGRLEVRLGVPQGAEGIPIVVSGENPGGRYHVRGVDRPDENTMHPDSAARLEFRYFNARLFLGDEDTAGHETVKIAELVAKSRHDPEPELSRQYIPPLVDVSASHELQTWLARVCRNLRDTNRALARDLASRPHELALQSGWDAGVLFKLNATNTLLATVEQLCRTKGVHPFETYRGLCQLAGSLALFSKERCCPDFPDYDHEDLGPRFEWITKKIDELLEYTWSRTWDVEEFKEITARRFECSFSPEYLHPRRELYLGITAEGEPAEELDRLIGGTFKLVGIDDVEMIRQAAVPGIALARNGKTVRRLPERTDVVYYRLDPTGTSPERWAGARESAKLCLISEGRDLKPFDFGLYITREV